MKIDFLKNGDVWRELKKARDKFWATVFVSAMLVLFVWNSIFLNAPAFDKWITATANTYLLGVFSTALAFLFGGAFVAVRIHAENKNRSLALSVLRLVLDFLKSIPQIVWLLFGYVFLIYNFSDTPLRYAWLAFVLALVFANEVHDEIIGRINFFKKSGFYEAMLAAGISERRIILRDVLLLNSLPHLINRAIIVFASVVFLLCSADFIVSVGLSNELSLSSLPVTLGNVLANISSKEDILAAREVFANPLYLPKLFTANLQGVSAAFTLVFTLISAYKISNGLVERKKLVK